MEFEKTKPIYYQIVEYVYESIINGTYPPGEKIPSVREMAGVIEVNHNTIQRAYNYLQERGIVVAERGIGLYIAVDALAKVKETREEDFFRDELPAIFRTVQLLEIDWSKIISEYEIFTGRTK
ncbi:MAG: GntR family transcriptional regulator [Bacillota bacterium]